jgi:HAE1 family hydrophobic/amphiphilic exporter-1
MIADIFIRRPVTAIVVSIVLVLVGILAITNLPVGQYPDITPPQVQIRSTFTGADALTVEQTVTTPIETQVNGSPGMMYMQSNSASDGSSSISAYFSIGTDPDIATLDVQNRVSFATPRLPEEVRQLGITVRKRNPSILMVLAIYSPNGTHNISFLNNYTNIYIKDALLRVPGVGDIFTVADDFSMRVWLDPDKMAQLGLTAKDVITSMQQQNIQLAAGSVGAPPQNNSQAFEYTVLTNSRLSTEDDFNKVVVRSNPATGAIVYLKDVARVELGKFRYASNSFVDGKPAALLLVYQAPSSNALQVADGIYKGMDELKKTLPKDVDFVVSFESFSVIKVSISEVVRTLLEALLLVTLVVFLFLQNWRATLIPVLAIPVSIIGTFAFFIPLGFTINTLTMFGFVLAIGIVVDDAIVVVEAVQHYIDNEKLSAKEATKKAMNDISGPVVAIALILAAVFVPVGFIPGIVGRLYQQFAITIAISVLISAFVALSLTPALCSILLKPHDQKRKPKGIFEKFFNAFNTRFESFTGRYTRWVNYFIKYARYVVILLVCIFVGTFLLFKTKATSFIPKEDDGRLYVTYEIPEASSTTRSLTVLDSIMTIMKSTPGIAHFAGIGGLNVVTFSNKSNSGTLFTMLKPWDERKDKSQQLDAIISTLQKRLATIKQARIVIIPPPAIPGLGRTGGFTFELQQQQSTDSIQEFENVVQNFVAALNKRPEIDRAFTYFTAKTPGYNVTVDRDKCEKMGVNVSDVYTTLATYLGSSYVNDFTIYGRNFRVVAQADTGYRKNIQEIGGYYVRNQQGTMVPLSTLVSYAPTENASVISHFNLFRTAEVNGDAAPGYSSGMLLMH